MKLQRLLSSINTANITKEKVFLGLPAGLGAGVGAVWGGYEGYTWAQHEHYLLNVFMTTSGIFYGGFIGAATGLIWPISVPVAVCRHIYPAPKKEYKY